MILETWHRTNIGLLRMQLQSLEMFMTFKIYQRKIFQNMISIRMLLLKILLKDFWYHIVLWNFNMRMSHVDYSHIHLKERHLSGKLVYNRGWFQVGISLKYCFGKFGDDKSPTTLVLEISRSKMEKKQQIKDFNQWFTTPLNNILIAS